MIRNYIKIALRNISRQKGSAFINIFGLAIGFTCALLIFSWVYDELTYDRFHDNLDRIYRIEQDQFYSGRAFLIACLGLFGLAAVPAFVIALLTVSYQAIKAARTNPSNSLRYE